MRSKIVPRPAGITVVPWCWRSAIPSKRDACTPWIQTARASVPAKTRTKRPSRRRMRRLESRSVTSSAAPAGRGRSAPGRRARARASSRAWDSIRAFADALESCELSRFVSPCSWIRSRPSSSRRTFSWSTATLTATTPASRTASTTIQTTPPNGRVLALRFGAVRGRGRRPRTGDRRRVDACSSGPARHHVTDLHGGAELRGCGARVRLELARSRPHGLPGQVAQEPARCRRRRSGTRAGTCSRAPARG